MLKIDPKLHLSHPHPPQPQPTGYATPDHALHAHALNARANRSSRRHPAPTSHPLPTGPRIVWRADAFAPTSFPQGLSSAIPAKRRTRSPLHLVSSAARERLATRQLRRTLARTRLIESLYVLAAAGTAAILWWAAR